MHRQAKGTDYPSRVAWLAGIPLDRVMLDNTEAVKDLDAPLAGVNLLLCGPAPGEGGSEGPGGGGTADREQPIDVILGHCVNLMQRFVYLSSRQRNSGSKMAHITSLFSARNKPNEQ
jgi:hypothetical protein